MGCGGGLFIFLLQNLCNLSKIMQATVVLLQKSGYIYLTVNMILFSYKS